MLPSARRSAPDVSEAPDMFLGTDQMDYLLCEMLEGVGTAEGTPEGSAVAGVHPAVANHFPLLCEVVPSDSEADAGRGGA